MNVFFHPKSKLSVSRPLATCMNTLNMLAPALLLSALCLAAAAHAGHIPPDVRQAMLGDAGLLALASLVIRVIWGVAVRKIAAGAIRKAGAKTGDAAR